MIFFLHFASLLPCLVSCVRFFLRANYHTLSIASALCADINIVYCSGSHPVVPFVRIIADGFASFVLPRYYPVCMSIPSAFYADIDSFFAPTIVGLVRFLLGANAPRFAPSCLVFGVNPSSSKCSPLSLINIFKLYYSHLSKRFICHLYFLFNYGRIIKTH